MDTQAARAFCIHGHFYQPSREDPLTNAIPREPGAAPFSNWNELVNSACYRPNAELNNFERISFNIGPTLAEWLSQADPLTLHRIVEQDRANLVKNGVGNGMAQAFHHTILPLAKPEDKQTQVRWGIEYFKYRFGHHPAGMWLPETAADLDTLDVLAQHNVLFTLLAPWQAKDKSVDVTRPYWVECREGRRIVVFFYHQELSTRVSFDPGATANADKFLREVLLPQYLQDEAHRKQDQFLLIASDGEAYGHHHPFRDKFLAYLFQTALDRFPVTSSYPALWLQTHSPEETIEIVDGTAWSCFHQLKRWSGDCSCTTNNTWKAPLREALDVIGDALDLAYADALKRFRVNPWALRNEYIYVLTGQMTEREFLNTRIGATLTSQEQQQLSQLLIAQCERQRIFTSCGWFFDDFNRIEPGNNIKYAAHAVWLTQQATGNDFTSLALRQLAQVRSHTTGLRGDQVFEQHMARIIETTALENGAGRR